MNACMELFPERLPWFAAGPAIGIIVVAMYGVANRPLGASGGFIDLVAFARSPRAGLKWTVYFLAGIVLGGMLAGWASGGAAQGTSYALFDERWGVAFAGRAMILGAAGVIMGFGIRVAGGCTSGHGICGTSLGSPASWVTTLAFMTSAIVSARLIYWLLALRS